MELYNKLLLYYIIFIKYYKISTILLIAYILFYINIVKLNSSIV
jgi:hypothetical protein